MYVTLQQLSTMLSIHPNTLYKLIKKGMPHIKVGRDYRFNFEAVEVWLNELNKREGE